MIFTEYVKIPLKDVEKDNVISDRGILEVFENVATHHSDSLNDGVNAVKEKGRAWVLIDWKVQVISRPHYGETFRVDTWSRENNIQDRKIATHRDFEMYNEEGKLCVIGTSKWVLMNTTTGRIANIDRCIQEMYLPEERCVFETEDIEKIIVPKESILERKYTIERDDVDFNLHMHNIYYMNLAYNALPEEVYNMRPFSKFSINYKREIKLGATVICKYTYHNDKHFVTIYNEDESKVHSVIILE